VFSTLGLPVPRKAEMWNMKLGELTDAVHVLPRDPLHFDGTLIRQRLGPLTLFEIHCAGVRLRHARTAARRMAHPSFQILMPLQGGFTMAHGKLAPVNVGTGSFCLIDQTAPYELIHGDGLRTIGLELPHSLLEACLPRASRHAGAVVRPDSCAGRLVAGLLRTLGTELSASHTSGTMHSMMTRSIAGFVAAAFVDPGSKTLHRGSKARLAAYREYVDSRLGDGDFVPLDLACHFRVSERYVRMIFQSAGEPLSAYLLRRRLERAAALLRNEHRTSSTITEIAMECGFNSATHFGQSFRRRYGTTPRRYRTRKAAPS
jgi:AraC-like DNA-binding protein